MATLKLVQEHFDGGSTAFRIYATYEGGWGSQSIDLQGHPYSEAARTATTLGQIEVPEESLWAGDFIDWPGVVTANRARLQSLADLHFRGTSSRLVI